MGQGHRVLEELRDLLQSRIDELERLGATHLDPIAERGARELSGLREHLDRRSRHKTRHKTKHGRCGTRRARRHERTARDRSQGLSGSGSNAAATNADPAALGARPTADERAMRRARRRAKRRIGFVSHLVSYGLTLAIILVATRSVRIAMAVAFFWGIGVFCHYLFAVAAPALRDRWIETEVGARSPQAVASERREVERRSRRSIEDLSASIAHEIRNPITAAKSLVQQMGEDPSSSENLEYADLALSELDRVERSISHLLRYARDEEPRFEALALRRVATAAVEGLGDRARTAGVELECRFDSPGEIRGDVEKLRRVVENLIANALDALVEAKTSPARIEVVGGENLAGTEVWMRVIDNGPGIPEDEQDRIFSPFFTTKESGTGLGLALSRKTVEAHGGRIDVLSETGRGTEFVITLPKDPERIGHLDRADEEERDELR